GSYDADPGTIFTYNWTQTETGSAVTLSDSTTAKPIFTAPTVEKETTLRFELVVTDGQWKSNADYVYVTVKSRESDLSTILVRTDARQYLPNANVTISGNIATLVPEKQILLKIIDPHGSPSPEIPVFLDQVAKKFRLQYD